MKNSLTFFWKKESKTKKTSVCACLKGPSVPSANSGNRACLSRRNQDKENQCMCMPQRPFCPLCELWESSVPLAKKPRQRKPLLTASGRTKEGEGKKHENTKMGARHSGRVRKRVDKAFFPCYVQITFQCALVRIPWYSIRHINPEEISLRNIIHKTTTPEADTRATARSASPSMPFPKE